MNLHLLGSLLVTAVVPAFGQGLPTQSPQLAPAHVVSQFDFSVAAAFAHVARQFGPEAERAWGDPDWDPQFVYPQPGKDIAGAVFTLQRRGNKSVWVNTEYDLVAGRMQYVSVIPEVMVCVIDVHAVATDDTHTAVNVSYTRTALTTEHNELVKQLAQKDKGSGPEWQRYIEHALGLQ